MFNDLIAEVIQSKSIPQNWAEAHITLIPKEQQNPTNIKNYRLISLLNEDYKIFVRILANRLKRVLVEFIQEDQTKQTTAGQCMNDTKYNWILR